ncbi:MAG: MFS transporter [Acidimicrobiales bacterium]
MRAAFRSLEHRNARLFFGGMLISNIGTWAQFTAVAILVDRLTASTTAIGVLTALQFTPMLLLGAWAGAVSDQVSRWKMSLITQSGLALQAVALAVLDLTGHATLPAVYTLTLVLGVVSAFDNPARRGFVTELVPTAQIPNAVSLNTAVMTGSRIFGPALTALLVNRVGTTWLFTANAVSFVAILASLLLLDRTRLHHPPRAPRGGTPIRDGLRAVWDNPVLRSTFIVFSVLSTFGYNYSVSLPRMSEQLWGNEQWYGVLLTMASLGSLIGALLTASRALVSLRWFALTGLVLAVGGLALSAAPSGWVAMATAVPMGIGGAGMVSAMNAIAQQECEPDMRGRILALTAVAFLGSYPIGGPITGLVGDHIGLRWSLAYGAVISLAAVAGFIWWALGQGPGAGRVATARSLLGATDARAAGAAGRP